MGGGERVGICDGGGTACGGTACDGVLMMVVGVAEAGLAELAEALEDEVADFAGIFDAMKDARVQRIVHFPFPVALAASPSAGGLDVDIGELEQA